MVAQSLLTPAPSPRVESYKDDPAELGDNKLSVVDMDADADTSAGRAALAPAVISAPISPQTSTTPASPPAPIGLSPVPLLTPDAELQQPVVSEGSTPIFRPPSRDEVGSLGTAEEAFGLAPAPAAVTPSVGVAASSTSRRGPLPTAPLLLHRRRSRAPLFPRDDEPQGLFMPLPLVGGDGPEPGFSFGTCSVPAPSPLGISELTACPDAGPAPDFQFGSLRLERRATPTAELGPFEYPPPVNERKTSIASSSSHASHISYISHLSHTSAAPPKSPVKVVAPPLPPKAPTDRYGHIARIDGIPPPTSPPLDFPPRRGSIASGQISQLAHKSPVRPRHNSSLSQSTYSALVGAPPAVPPSAPPSVDALRSLSASSTHSTGIARVVTRSPALSPTMLGSPTAGPVYVLPRTSTAAAPIAFAHAALPAPIPPSLLARRGSVPTNLLWGLRGGDQSVTSLALSGSPSGSGGASSTTASSTTASSTSPRSGSVSASSSPVLSPTSISSSMPKYAPRRPTTPLQRQYTREDKEFGAPLERERSILDILQPEGPKHSRKHSESLLERELSALGQPVQTSPRPDADVSPPRRPSLRSAHSDVGCSSTVRAAAIEGLGVSHGGDVEALLDTSDAVQGFDNSSVDHLDGEHGAHAGHVHSPGHEAHFPDPCGPDATHPLGHHTPFAPGSMIERRRPVASVPGLVAQPLSTVPSSDGYDE